jgi:K+/H+ antiporter YhaU regulatory subunit KhtT
MRKITFIDRLRYEFDHLMSQGTTALMTVLSLLTLLLIGIIALFLYLLDLKTSSDGRVAGFLSILWDVFNHAIDTGGLQDTEGDFLYLGGMFIATLSGIFLVSALIGIIANGFNSKLEELRKGRSFVVESGHTLILGWSEAIFTIIRQLILANAHQSAAAIVILAPRDKVEMEDEIRQKVDFFGKTRLICRTGNPRDFDDLEIVNPDRAGSIIILPPENHQGDIQVIKTLLALIYNPQRRPQPYHIVTQLYERQNQAVAKMIGKEEVLAFRLGGILGFMIVESVRQVHISRVITELIQFEGGEIYFREETDLVGKTFGELLMLYADASVIGLRLSPEEFLINPPMDTIIVPGSEIIAIADNERSFHLSPDRDYGIATDLIQVPSFHLSPPRQLLILGWNTEVPEILTRLAKYLAAGSQILLVANDAKIAAKIASLDQELANLTLKFRCGNLQDRSLLDELTLVNYDHVIVLSSYEHLSPELADAETLIVLLHLRDIGERSGRRFPIVTEIMEENNCDIIQLAQVDDVIVSNKLVSLILAQMSQNPACLPALLGLLDPDGNHLQLKPAGDYVTLGIPINFYTVVASAQRCHHLVLGYCLESEGEKAEKNFGVRLNPNKSEKVTFVEGDRLIIVAKDQS